ncbi:MAG: ATP-binding cassette domain-containing protein [Corynebacterium sp.]|nr:ATP-binding cassette domain-containing protein [Corynebacterium sp.]
MSVISFDGVKIRFPNGVEIIVPNFEVHEGEIVSLVGRNGCGKTTALTAALNLIAVSEGTITTNNCAIAAAHPDLPINTSLGVRTYLSSVCRLNGKKIGELESLMESSKLTSLKKPPNLPAVNGTTQESRTYRSPAIVTEAWRTVNN